MVNFLEGKTMIPIVLLTGKELLERYTLKAYQLVELVQQGLQPYREFLKPIPPPDSAALFYEILELKAAKEKIEKDYPGIEVLSVSRWRNRSVVGLLKKDKHGKIKKVKYRDGTNSEIRNEYDSLVAQIERLEAKYPKLPTWKGYRPPRNKNEAEQHINILLDAFYKRDDIPDLENRHEQEAKEKFPIINGIKGTESQNQSSIDEIEKLQDKKPITDSRKAIVLAEAAKLRHENPSMDKVRAKKRIDPILKTHGFSPYSRTNFNSIIKDLSFPPAKQGRKPAQKKK